MEVTGLDVEFKTNKLEKECTQFNIANRTYGEAMAEKIAQRMSELRSADSIEMLIQFAIGRCHPLKGNRKGEYAMVLVHPYRLVLEKRDRTIQLVRIISIQDYH